MKAALSTLGLVVLLAAAGGTTSGCAGGDDGTAPEQNLCQTVSFSSRAEIQVPTRCTSVNSNISAITYDQFSRPTSYNFSISCTDGSQTFTGRVSNIAWNNLGQAVGWDLTINGKNCPRFTA